MLKSYWRIAWRNLFKYKGFSLVNLSGLAIAFTCCLLMVLYIRHELSFDRFQENGNRIARVIMEYRLGNGDLTSGNFTSTKVLPAFQDHFPEVESGVRMSEGSGLIKIGDQVFEDPGFLFADSTFFSVFTSFPLKEGNPQQVLGQSNQLVITESAAKKYFGSKPAVGQIILVGAQQTPFTVTGIAADCPSNSQIRFNLLGSFSSLKADQRESYWNANYTTYLLLKDPEAISRLQPKIAPFMKSEMKDQNVYVNFVLEQFLDIHLHSPYAAFVGNTNINYIYIASGMALLILLIACFTYINMSTARSLERAREVGIRKVAGATRSQVFLQFIGESLILATTALLVSIGIVQMLLPAFNQQINRLLVISDLWQPELLLAGFSMVLCIAILAGTYPALVLSRFNPVKVLKGQPRNGNSGHSIRQGLIIFQFSISAFLLIATLVIQKQFHYIQNKSLGFNREQSLVVKMDSKVAEKITLLKTQFRQNPEVQEVSAAVSTPVEINGGYNMRSSAMPENISINVNANPVDEDYLKANQIELIAGEELSHQDVLDASHDQDNENFYHFLLNETAARDLGWKPQEAIGKKMFLDESRPGIVKGVVKDFHFNSLHNPIRGLVLFPSNYGSNLIIRISGHHMPATLAFLEAQWKQVITHRPFSYRFMEDDFNTLYAAEKQAASVIGVFSAVAIILACVGLLGLSAYVVQQRIREIGVRKVLGASVPNIVWMLASGFLKLVLIAFAIAMPIGWFAANKWLQDFSYRTSIGVDIFAGAALILATLALIAVSIQTVRAAIANPVKSLRSE